MLPAAVLGLAIALVTGMAVYGVVARTTYDAQVARIHHQRSVAVQLDARAARQRDAVDELVAAVGTLPEEAGATIGERDRTLIAADLRALANTAGAHPTVSMHAAPTMSGFRVADWHDAAALATARAHANAAELQRQRASLDTVDGCLDALDGALAKTGADVRVHLGRTLGAMPHPTPSGRASVTDAAAALHGATSVERAARLWAFVHAVQHVDAAG